MLSFDLGNATLIASSFLLSCMVGTGVYQHLVVMPSWFEEPPVSFKKINQYGKAEVRFGAPLQGLTLASMLLAFLGCRHDPARRTLIIAAGVGYVAVAGATAAYFAPNIVKWGKLDASGASASSLRSATRRWLGLSWVRQATLAVGAVLLLTALATGAGE
jgi:hypothetical protein